MNEQTQRIHIYNEVINMKDLVMTILKRRVMIISFALIAAIITGIVSVFFLPRVYESSMNIVINMPASYNTKYGSYALPISTNDQYINLIKSNDVLVNTIRDMRKMGYDPKSKETVEDLLEKIQIEEVEDRLNDKCEQNTFSVIVSARNPEEAQKLAQTLYDNYVRYLDVMLNEWAVTHYFEIFNTSLKSLEISIKSTKEILRRNEELLSTIPKTIDQKEAMKEILEMPNTSDYVVLEKIINPNYTKIEADIVENRQSINNMENSVKIYKEYLEELEEVKKTINRYYESGETNGFDSKILGVVDTSIYLASQPVVPTRKTKPHNAMNIAIGLVIGGMIGVCSVYIKEYWLYEAHDEKKQIK